MAKYKVCYSGYAYVEASSENEAKQKFLDDQVTSTPNSSTSYAKSILISS